MVVFQNKIKELSLLKYKGELFIERENRMIDVDFSKIGEINIFQERSISKIAWKVVDKVKFAVASFTLV